MKIVSHKHLHFRKRRQFAWTLPDFKGHILLWLGEIFEPHFRAFESGTGLGRYNGCIPTIPNARESEPYTLYCHQYYTVHTIKYHTVNIHLRHSAGSNLHINPTWKWIHEIWPLKGESLTFLKKIAQKWPKIMAYFQILFWNLGPHLFLSHHSVVKCFVKQVHPRPPVTRPKTPPTPLAIQILNYQTIYFLVHFDDWRMWFSKLILHCVLCTQQHSMSIKCVYLHPNIHLLLYLIITITLVIIIAI